MPTWGSVYWPWFLIVTSIGTLVPEIYALCTNSANTLSDYSWRELHVRAGIPFSAHTAAWLLSLGVWALLIFWVTEHIWFYRFR
jgi:hypothetical protein